MEKWFEEFQPIFGEVKPEWENPSCNLPLLPFLFHLHALDLKHLRIHITDFQSYTWESVKSIQQLEDLKDDAGIGGSWSEFITYVMDSIKSANVKLVLGGFSESGAKFAKLVAHKTKGMPLITIYLDRLMSSCASDAIANLSWEIFKAFKTGKELVVKEQQRAYELTERLLVEKEKNESIQAQLRFSLSSKKQKISKFTDSHKSSPTAAPFIDLEVSDIPNSLGTPRTPSDSLSMKVGSLVPYQRTKVRGFIVDDPED